MDRAGEAGRAIEAAMAAVAALPRHPDYQDAEILLGNARRLVADAAPGPMVPPTGD